MSRPVPANAAPCATIVSPCAIRAPGPWHAGARDGRRRVQGSRLTRAAARAHVAEVHAKNIVHRRRHVLDAPSEHDLDGRIRVVRDHAGDLVEGIEPARQLRDHPVRAAHERRVEVVPAEACKIDSEAIRVRSERPLAGDRILVHADPGAGRHCQDRQRERAEAVADHDDVVGDHARLRQDQPVALIGGDEIVSLDVGPAAEARRDQIECLLGRHA